MFILKSKMNKIYLIASAHICVIKNDFKKNDYEFFSSLFENKCPSFVANEIVKAKLDLKKNNYKNLFILIAQKWVKEPEESLDAEYDCCYPDSRYAQMLKKITKMFYVDDLFPGFEVIEDGAQQIVVYEYIRPLFTTEG